ncbi:LacI family DNA-binding transcriptional regulator [Cupriavidus agavae]|uniref:LacI family transcriptional regulator n=1 Tax=Cupriavidus agavae TaxID=1001822 RepID=A0A4Q7RSB2_9BURK|nr:substrate-binding domain-containing protein [Cupriavidus agavae]RZT36484.1 LacI family transcriptional regulator [Cupriavidus agavae]
MTDSPSHRSPESTGKPRRVTIHDVARAAGVSLTTVSHALNDRGVVDPETRARVKRIAGELGYRASVRARRLQSGRANCIALLSSMPFAVAGGTSRLGFMMEVAAIAAESAMARGLGVVLVPPLEGAGGLLESLDIDGAIVIEPVAGDPNIARLRGRDVSIVSIGREPLTDTPEPYVDLQSAHTANLLLEHLHDQGCRQIGLMIGDGARQSYLEMERVYRAFTASRGLPCHLVKAPEALGEAAGADACAQLLEQLPALDGLCAPVDAFAVGAMHHLRAVGKSVPGQVLVVTRYDGIRARAAQPPLTAVNLHLEAVAALAVELLFAHISGESGQRSVIGPSPELVPRASSLRN